MPKIWCFRQINKIEIWLSFKSLQKFQVFSMFYRVFSFIFEVFHLISWPNEMISTVDIQILDGVTLPIIPKMESQQRVLKCLVWSHLNEDDLAGSLLCSSLRQSSLFVPLERSGQKPMACATNLFWKQYLKRPNCVKITDKKNVQHCSSRISWQCGCGLRGQRQPFGLWRVFGSFGVKGSGNYSIFT